MVECTSNIWVRNPTVLGVLFHKINKCLSRARRSLLCPTVGLPRHKRKRVSFPPLNRSTVRAENSLEGKAALAKQEKAALRWGDWIQPPVRVGDIWP